LQQQQQQQQQHEASRIVLAFGLETNSMTSLNINTRLLIALGIVIDFLDLERQPNDPERHTHP